MALRGHGTHVYTLVAGLGGRPITQASLTRFIHTVEDEPHADVHFLDLKHDVVEAELARAAKTRRAGPIAENVLRRVTPGRAL
jgi:pyruvate ferredoxin oxidoreductase alpha subunit